MKYQNVLRAFYTRTWAIETNAYHALRGILEAKANMRGLTDTEIDAWQAAHPYGATKNTQNPTGDTVAIIPIYGPMLQNAGNLDRVSGATDTRELATAIRAAADSPNVREILLDIDSPGGEAASVDVAAEAVRYARERKPITAVTQGMMASAAYWVGSQATRIVASPGSMIGSISVIYTHHDWSAKNEADGVKITHITSGNKKAAWNSDHPLTDEGRADINRIISEYHNAFVSAVAAGRGRDEAYVQTNWADGRVEIGTTAKQIGLVDEIGTLQSVLDAIQHEANSTHVGATAGRSTTVKMSDVSEILRAGNRVGAETDEPEGERRLELSDTLATRMADAIDQHVQTQETTTEQLAAERRTAMAERALNVAALPPVSTESDLRFHDQIVRTAIAADDDATATQAVAGMIEDRKQLLTTARGDNHPGLPQPDENPQAQESRKAVASIRRSTGLTN